MIVTTMTGKEISDEVMNDIPNVMKIFDNKDNKVKRIILKSNIFPVYLHSFVRTSQKNNWLLLWEARSRKNIGDLSIISLICWTDTANGRYAFMPSWFEDEHIIIMFPPHFFVRFRDRMNLDLEGNELMLRFFQYNNNFAFKYETEKIGDSSRLHVYGSCIEGVCLGTKICDCDMFMLKTFITYDMCKGEQIEDFARYEKIRQEMHEEIITSSENKLKQRKAAD